MDRKYPISKEAYSGLSQLLDDILRSSVTDKPCMDGGVVRIISSAEHFAKKFTPCSEQGAEWRDRLDNYLLRIRSGD